MERLVGANLHEFDRNVSQIVLHMRGIEFSEKD